MVKCKICDKEFKQITRDHLMYKHMMSYKEYKILYPEDNLTPTRTSKSRIKYLNRPKVKCQICNRELYRLSGTHTKSKHGITFDEYLKQFPNTISYISVPEERELIKKHHADVNGKNNPFYGKRWNIKMRKQISDKVKLLWETDEYKNDVLEHRYCNGNSKNKYRYSFEFRFNRELIFKLYGNLCNICGSTKNVVCHHIDYNKSNNSYKNLIPLCNSCHSKTNFNREYWKRIFLLDTYPKPKEYYNYIDSTIKLDEEELPFL